MLSNTLILKIGLSTFAIVMAALSEDNPLLIDIEYFIKKISMPHPSKLETFFFPKSKTLFIEDLILFTNFTIFQFERLLNSLKNSSKQQAKEQLGDIKKLNESINNTYNKLETVNYFNNEQAKTKFLELYSLAYQIDEQVRAKAFEGETNPNDPYANYVFTPAAGRKKAIG